MRAVISAVVVAVVIVICLMIKLYFASAWVKEDARYFAYVFI